MLCMMGGILLIPVGKLDWDFRLYWGLVGGVERLRIAEWVVGVISMTYVVALVEGSLGFGGIPKGDCKAPGSFLRRYSMGIVYSLQSMTISEYTIRFGIRVYLYTTPLPSPLLLKFIHLILPIPQLLQHPRQLPLVRRTLLRPAHRLIQPRRPTHEDLDILLLRLRQHRLQQVLADVSRAPVPVLAGRVDRVEGAEALRVGVFEVFEFVLEQDVGFG